MKRNAKSTNYFSNSTVYVQIVPTIVVGAQLRGLETGYLFSLQISDGYKHVQR